MTRLLLAALMLTACTNPVHVLTTPPVTRYAITWVSLTGVQWQSPVMKVNFDGVCLHRLVMPEAGMWLGFEENCGPDGPTYFTMCDRAETKVIGTGTIQWQSSSDGAYFWASVAIP